MEALDFAILLEVDPRAAALDDPATGSKQQVLDR